MRLLLVDDEPALRELLRATFEGAGIAVDEAGSAAEAEAAIASAPPDLVVLDLRSPAVGGAELCARLRSEPRTRDIPVVLVTGRDTHEAEVAGADAVLLKPFSLLDLLAVVQRLAGNDTSSARERAALLHDEEELLLYGHDLRHLLDSERRQREQLERSYLETVTVLATALEWKDNETHEHSQRVRRYARELLVAIDPRLAARDHGIDVGFLLHDVGTIGIPDTILRKPGPLTPEERERMQQHTLLGETMLSHNALLRGEGLHVVRSHHERWDGTGYPDGLRGDETPLAARIFAVADALDAMTTDRPYRRALAWEEAREEIVLESGRHFDPVVVEAFRDCEHELLAAYRETAST